ncbi:MAG TPA: hypothetical protein VKJ45_20185 [Blastocatellia bacterium]|nr:hypothetical protein [Blastocatellia bacterium]
MKIRLLSICCLMFAGTFFAGRLGSGAAQTANPAPPADIGDYGDPSLPDRAPVDPTAPPDDNEAADRIDANRLLIGDLTEDMKLNALRELQRQQQLYAQQMPGANPPKGVSSWTSLGPTQAKYETNGVTLNVSDSGRVRTILPHPTDPDTVYVLTSGGGLWKTTTFTHTNPQWEPKTDALVSTTGGSVAFGRDPNTLYLGIGDPFDVLGLIAGVMVKSTDGGNSWSPFVNLPGAGDVRDVKVDTSGPNDIVLVATDFGLFRSTDNGATYIQTAAGVGQQFYNNQSVWSLARTSAGWLATALPGTYSGTGSISYSTDRGATWNPIPNAGNGYNTAGRTTLAVASGGDSVVYGYAATPGPSVFADRDLFKSTDGGLDWAPLNITNKTVTNPDPCWQIKVRLMHGQAWYDQMILVDPIDASRNTVYLGGSLATAKTVDGGNTWTLLSVWLPFHSLVPQCSNLPYVHADCHAAAFSTLGGQSTVFFGTDGGVFISTDGGASWSDDKNNGIVSTLFNSVVSSTKNSQNLIAGAQDDGTRARLGSSPVFNQVFGGDGEGVAWSQANNAFTLTTTPGVFIYRSPGLLPNTTGNWTEVDSSINALDYYPFYTNLQTPAAAADPTGLQFFTMTGWRVYKTSDGGTSWNVIGEAGVSPGLRPKGSAPVFRLTHHVIGVSPLDTNHIAVSENLGILAITTDGGASWVERHLISLVPGYGGFNSSPAWANNTTLYLSSENPNGGAERLLKSTDGGATWALAQNGLPDVPINRIIVDPRDASGNTVYAATWIGVYRTTDGGASWSLFGAGLPNVEAADLYMPPDGSFLRVATYGRGVWEIRP